MKPPRWFYWLPAVSLTFAIAWASSARFSAGVSAGWLTYVFEGLHTVWPSLTLETLNHVVRKTGHVSAYGALALCWQLALRHSSSRHPQLAGIALALLIACWDEANQSWVPERTGTPRDVLWDLSGMLVFLVLQRFCLTFFKKKTIPAPGVR